MKVICIDNKPRFFDTENHLFNLLAIGETYEVVRVYASDGYLLKETLWQQLLSLRGFKTDRFIELSDLNEMELVKQKRRNSTRMNNEAALKNIEKKLNALRSYGATLQNVATEALKELAELKPQQAPQQPRRRQNLKDARVDDYALMVATGSIKKPLALRKTPVKK